MYFNGKLKDTIAVQQFEETEKYNSNDRYMFKVLPKNGMELWDRQTCTRVNISLDTENRINRGHYFFRGIELDASAFPYRKMELCLTLIFMDWIQNKHLLWIEGEYETKWKRRFGIL